MFIKSDFVGNDGLLLVNVNEKVEYFFDLWGCVFDGYTKEELSTGLRFESHRTLVSKMLDQIKYNKPNAYKNVMRYANLNIFDSSNIISRYRPISSRIKQIRSCTRKGFDVNKCERQILGMKKFLFRKNNYSSLLCGDLFDLLNNNYPITKKNQDNLKIIANCIVSELYFSGYSFKSIKDMPRLLLLRSDVNKFPWNKVKTDFTSSDEYDRYCVECARGYNLHTLVKGIYNFINLELEDGYVAFKVNGLSLVEPNEIKVGGIVFYNPQVNRKMNLGGMAKISHFSKVELFQFGDKGNGNPSGCNAIAPLSFRKLNKERREVDVIRAFKAIEQSLPYLSYLSMEYSSSRQVYPSLNYDQKIFLSRNMTPPEISLVGLVNEESRINISGDDELQEFTSLNDFYIGNINVEIESHIRTLDLFLEVRKQQAYKWHFSFGQIWSCWEALFKEGSGDIKRIDLTSFLIKCYHKNIKRRYLDKALWSLRVSLQRVEFFDERDYHFLSENELEQIGLGKEISVRRFRKNSQDVLGNHQSLLVRQEYEMISKYLSSDHMFYDELNKWIEHTVYEVYVARNLDFHSRHDNDFVYGKLKKDFLWISIKGLIEITRELKRYENRDIYQFVKK